MPARFTQRLHSKEPPPGGNDRLQRVQLDIEARAASEDATDTMDEVDADVVVCREGAFTEWVELATISLASVRESRWTGNSRVAHQLYIDPHVPCEA